MSASIESSSCLESVQGAEEIYKSLQGEIRGLVALEDRFRKNVSQPAQAKQRSRVKVGCTFRAFTALGTLCHSCADTDAILYSARRLRISQRAAAYCRAGGGGRRVFRVEHADEHAFL
ncbi:hypothetical protein L1887_50241 [Cichorium endivia]|nr:hypothetical protein L1887_50241 [Cichorium endivia]